MNAIVVAKKSNSNIIINVEKICCKNIIGNSSCCDLKIIQNKNAQIEQIKKDNEDLEKSIEETLQKIEEVKESVNSSSSKIEELKKAQ